MVYLTIPADLTEEESMLKKKYDLLRKLQDKLKASFQEPPPKKVVEKRCLEAKPDAKEVAKKLLKSGAISAIKKESKEKKVFKRPKGHEKKDSNRSSKSGSSYQPFSSSQNSLSNGSIISSPPELSSAKSSYRHRSFTSGSLTNSASPELSSRPVKKLYDSFVSSGKLEDEVRPNSDRYYRYKEKNDTAESPREGNTVYVRGYDLTTELVYGLTREFLLKTFESIGNIIKIYIPENKQCGFVTFKRNEFAYEAMNTLNGTISDNVKLSVYFAKRQFHSSGNVVS